MTDLNVEGMAIAPSVVESIAAIAVKEVEGVSIVNTASANGLLGMFNKQSSQGLEVSIGENNKVSVSVHVEVAYGSVLPEVADKIREAVSDAVTTQVGAEIESVDVYVDAVKFTD